MTNSGGRAAFSQGRRARPRLEHCGPVPFTLPGKKAICPASWGSGFWPVPFLDFCHLRCLSHTPKYPFAVHSGTLGFRGPCAPSLDASLGLPAHPPHQAGGSERSCGVVAGGGGVGPWLCPAHGHPPPEGAGGAPAPQTPAWLAVRPDTDVVPSGTLRAPLPGDGCVLAGTCQCSVEGHQVRPGEL